MAAAALDGLDLPEAELRALARAAAARLGGRPRPAPGRLRRAAPAGAGGDFQGLRDYAPGDSLRAVNWLASARSREVQTQVYQSEAAARWHVCLDGSASMSLGTGKWRLARQLAAAFAYLLLAGGGSAGLLVYSGRLDAACPPGRGRGQYPRLLDLLRGLEPRPEGGGSDLECCFGRLPAASSALVVSDFLDGGAMRDSLVRWRAAGLNVQAVQVLAEDECELPPGGPLLLRDVESGGEILLESAAEAARLARGRLAKWTLELQGHCARRGIPFSAADPARGWRAALLAHLQTLPP